MIHGRIEARDGLFAKGITDHRRVAVIGAGPAGLTAALQIARRGVAVDVYESSAHVGGLSRSIDLWGRRVDLGPHRFFSTDARVNGFWHDVVREDYHIVERLTRIRYDGKLFAYPLQPLDIVSQLGIHECSHIVLSYALQQIRGGVSEAEACSFESWVVGRFGRRLYERFFKSYSEKLWGIPCTRLSDDFAAQRIRRLTLRDVVLNAFRGCRGPRHRTLADRFAYPTDGTGMVYERLADLVTAHGGRIHLRRPIRRIEVADHRVVGLRTDDGCVERFDHVVSTMPLTLLVDGLPDTPVHVQHAASRLSFRNTVLVYLRVEDPNLFPDQWIYVHDPGVGVGRVTNFNNWGPARTPRTSPTILCCEYWCSTEDAAWNAADGVVEQRAVADLRRIGLLEDQVVDARHVIRIPRSYPVYEKGYRRHVATIAGHLGGIGGLSAIGRYGSFKYNNQDHSILMGLLAAENVLFSSGHDLWGLNSDFDAYQEEGSMSDAGPGEALSGELFEAHGTAIEERHAAVSSA